MNKIFIYILMLLNFSKCSTKNNENYYKQLDKQQIDTSIASKVLDIIENIPIEENDDLIINEIYFADIDSLANRLIITDPPNRNLILYNYKTGKLLKYVKADLNLSDSIAYSGKTPFKHNNKSFRYLKMKEYNSYKIDERGIDMIKNRFMYPKFINGQNIYVLSLIYDYAITYDSMKIIDNTAAIIKFDKNLNLKEVVTFMNNNLSYSLPFTFNMDQKNNQFLISCSNNLQPFLEKKI